MNFTLRTMTELDLPSVAEIEAGVFTDWYRIYRREPEPLSERTVEALRYAISLDPDGNLVAVADDGAMVGFILARTWGKVGWFGTFGVPTQFQGLGIGTALVNRAVDYLEQKADIIGLETMPESGANIGLYTKLGFVATYPTHILELSLIREAERFSNPRVEETVVWETLGSSGLRRTLREMREISDSILSGLDYSGEVEAIHAHGFGRTLLSRGAGDRLDGFVILRSTSIRRENISGRAYIHALAVRPGADGPAVLDDLLRQVWASCVSLGLARVAAGLSGRYQSALLLLLERGFRVMRAGIRMVRLPVSEEVFSASDAIHLSRWAG
jgi:ribosomal protein S18 acetylase RimI-like enzyme